MPTILLTWAEAEAMLMAQREESIMSNDSDRYVVPRPISVLGVALRPCPFCGAGGELAVCSEDRRSWFKVVECGKCGAQGPSGPKVKNVGRAWNRRVEASHERLESKAEAESKALPSLRERWSFARGVKRHLASHERPKHEHATTLSTKRK